MPGITDFPVRSIDVAPAGTAIVPLSPIVRDGAVLDENCLAFASAALLCRR